METKTNKTALQVIILAAVIIFGFAWIHSIKSNIEYADFECPVCGSCEVLKLHTDDDGNTDYKCPDCHTEYTSYNQHND